MAPVVPRQLATVPPITPPDTIDNLRAALLTGGFAASWIFGLVLLVLRELYLSRKRRSRTGWSLSSPKEFYLALGLSILTGLKTVVECIQIFDLVLRLPLYTYNDTVSNSTARTYLLMTTLIQSSAQGYLLYVVQRLFTRLLPPIFSYTLKWPILVFLMLSILTSTATGGISAIQTPYKHSDGDMFDISSLTWITSLTSFNFVFFILMVGTAKYWTRSCRVTGNEMSNVEEEKLSHKAALGDREIHFDEETPNATPNIKDKSPSLQSKKVVKKCFGLTLTSFWRIWCIQSGLLVLLVQGSTIAAWFTPFKKVWWMVPINILPAFYVITLMLWIRHSPFLHNSPTIKRSNSASSNLSATNKEALGFSILDHEAIQAQISKPAIAQIYQDSNGRLAPRGLKGSNNNTNVKLKGLMLDPNATGSKSSTAHLSTQSATTVSTLKRSRWSMDTNSAVGMSNNNKRPGTGESIGGGTSVSANPNKKVRKWWNNLHVQIPLPGSATSTPTTPIPSTPASTSLGDDLNMLNTFGARQGTPSSCNGRLPAMTKEITRESIYTPTSVNTFGLTPSGLKSEHRQSKSGYISGLSLYRGSALNNFLNKRD